jgi:hypothetical protein
LAIGDLINADIPQPLRGQALGIVVAPQHLLGPLLERVLPVSLRDMAMMADIR